MINDKAVKLLRRIADEQHGDERREALEMAVRALVEPNIGQKTIDCIIKRLSDEDRTTGDCISRQQAIDAIEEMQMAIMRSEFFGDQFIFTGMSRALQAIKDLPSAQPKRKKGKWIFHETENDRYDDMICPFCKMTYTVDAYRIDDIGFTAEDFNYCPNCGAKMEVEHE